MSERPSESELTLIEAALAEDIGEADWTTRWTISEEARGSARIVARADGVIAGTRPAEGVFRRLDPELRLDWRRADGEPWARDRPERRPIHRYHVGTDQEGRSVPSRLVGE